MTASNRHRARPRAAGSAAQAAWRGSAAARRRTVPSSPGSPPVQLRSTETICAPPRFAVHPVRISRAVTFSASCSQRHIEHRADDVVEGLRHALVQARSPGARRGMVLGHPGDEALFQIGRPEPGACARTAVRAELRPPHRPPRRARRRVLAATRRKRSWKGRAPAHRGRRPAPRGRPCARRHRGRSESAGGDTVGVALVVERRLHHQRMAPAAPTRPGRCARCRRDAACRYKRAGLCRRRRAVGDVIGHGKKLSAKPRGADRRKSKHEQFSTAAPAATPKIGFVSPGCPKALTDLS